MLATLTHVAGTWTHRKTGRPANSSAPESAGIGVHRHARGDTVEGLDRLPGGARGKGRSGAALAGLLAILAGAWLVVGPSEWPVLKSTQQIVFAPAAPMRSFTCVVGANLGPGLLLAITGAFALAWAMRVSKVRRSA